MTSNGPCLVSQVVVQRVRTMRGAVDVLGVLQDVDVRNPSRDSPRRPRRSMVALPAQDVRAEVAVGPAGVAVRADPLGQVEHDGDRQHVVLAGQRDELLARLRLDVRGVHDGQPAGGESLAGDVIQHVEGVAGRRLVVLVVGDQPAAEVAAEHLGRPRRRAEANVDFPDPVTPTRTTRLSAGTASSRRLGVLARRGGRVMPTPRDAVRGRVNTASWVGGPTSGSSVPTGR